MKLIFGSLLHLWKNLVTKKNLLRYKLGGRRPWTSGYFEHKWSQIKKTIVNNETMLAFETGGPLPSHFGQRLEERAVEYPWLLANLPKTKARLLDAGSALNFKMLLEHPKLSNKKITIVTINPESNSFTELGVSYFFSDIRSLPIKDKYFDIITCISTLEHVGMDNTLYIKNKKYKENNLGDYIIAANELKRVLKRGGSLFITVPFGKHKNYGFFQQFDKKMVEGLVSMFNKNKCEQRYYMYTTLGWQTSTIEECQLCQYTLAKKARRSKSLPAAATAVACLKLVK